MNKEHTQRIFTDFPEFFKHKEDKMASLMVFGIECGDGWNDLIYVLCSNIKSYFISDDPRHKVPEEFYVTQIKEKFGGLRFYVSCAPEKVFSFISKAEVESYKTCEICGNKGKLRDDLPWWKTLCSEHYKERLNAERRPKSKRN